MQVKDVGIRLDQPIYDTISIAADAVDGIFFAVPHGGILVGAALKDYGDTNLVQAGRLESGYVFECNGMSMFFPDGDTRATQADIRAIDRGWLKFILSDTVLITLPISLVPNGGAELVLSSNIAAAVTEYQLNKGSSVSQNRFYMVQNPITIDPQQTIRVEVGGFGTVAAATKLTCVLWGNMTRPLVG